MGKKFWLFARYAAPFLLLALIVSLLRLTNLDDVLNEAWFDDHIRSQGFWGWVFFVLLGGVLSSLGTPRQLIAFFGGYAFGGFAGMLLSTLGALFGCSAVYFYARRFGPAVAAKRLREGRLKKIDAYFREAPFLSTITIRLLPVGNNALINLFAGVGGIPALPFLAGSGLGYLPQMLIFALLGSGIQVDATSRFIVSAALFLFSGLIGMVLYRRCRRAVMATASMGAEAVEENGAMPENGVRATP